MRHGIEQGEENLFCLAIPSIITIGYAVEQGEVPSNIEIISGACNVFNDIEEAKASAEKLRTALETAGLEYVTISITANQNNASIANSTGTLTDFVCAGKTTFTVCSKYAEKKLGICPQVGSPCLPINDNNTTIQCLENGVQTTRTCVDI